MGSNYTGFGDEKSDARIEEIYMEIITERETPFIMSGRNWFMTSALISSLYIKPENRDSQTIHEY